MRAGAKPWTSLGLALVSVCVIAQSAEEKHVMDMDLEELLNVSVEAAAKREQRLMDATQAVEVLTGEELRAMGVHKLGDALKHMTSVDVLDLDTLATYVTLRGAMQQGQPRMVQVLVDGIPFYNGAMGATDMDNLPLPIEAIDKIEVVRGPASCLYGANAVVGVIAITTRKPASGATGMARIHWHTHETHRMGWESSVGNGMLDVQGGSSQAAYGPTYAPCRYRFFYNPKDKLVFDANRGKQDSGFAKVNFRFGDTCLYALLGQGTKHADVYTGYPHQYALNRTIGVGWEQSWGGSLKTHLRINRLVNRYDIQVAPTLMAMLDSYEQQMPELAPAVAAIKAMSGQCYTWLDYNSNSVAFQVNWDATSTVHWVAGCDYRKYNCEPSMLIAFRQREEAIARGVFLNGDWSLTDQWAISLGLRAEDDSIGGGRLSPRAVAVYSPTYDSHFRLGYYSSTRSPQLQEIRGSFEFPAQRGVSPNNDIVLIYRILPNPDLKPEKVSSVEAGWRQSIGAWSWDLTLFYMQFSQLVQQTYIRTLEETFSVTIGGVSHNRLKKTLLNHYSNAGNATNLGAELSLNYKINSAYMLGMNATLMDYHMDGYLGPDDGRFTYASLFKCNVWLRLSHGKFGAYGALQYVGPTRMDFLPINQSSVDSVRRQAITQLQLHGTYEMFPGFRIHAFGRNLLKASTDSGAGGASRLDWVMAAQREMGLGCSYRF